MDFILHNSKLLGYVLVIASAIFMGIGEGSVVALEFNYALPKVLPILLTYFIGVLAYLAGLFLLANQIGTLIGLWEAVAIGLSVFVAITELVKKGHKVPFSGEIVFWGVLLLIGVSLIIVAGDKFIAFFLTE